MSKLIIFATHPIQYQVPLYQEMAKKLDVLVVYSLKQNAKGQADAGFGVEFEWDVPLLEGYNYHYLENLSKSPNSGTFNGIVINKGEVNRVLDDFKPTHALVHGWFPKAMLQIASVLKGYKSLKVFCRGDSTLLMTQNPIKKLVKEVYIRWVLRKFDAFLYVGKENKAFYEHYGVNERQLFPVHHCINTPLFKRLYPGKVESTNGKFRLGFVGKFISKKQPLLLIEALAKSKHKEDITLNFVGSGPLEKSMRRLAKELKVEVNFLGFMNQTELIKKGYPNIDCLVLPSAENETWGLVVNEAMTLGIPAIVSDRVGCHSDLVLEGKTGGVFISDECSSLVRQINNWYKKYSVHSVIDKIPESYSLEGVVNQLTLALAKF